MLKFVSYNGGKFKLINMFRQINASFYILFYFILLNYFGEATSFIDAYSPFTNNNFWANGIQFFWVTNVHYSKEVLAMMFSERILKIIIFRFPVYNWLL